MRQRSHGLAAFLVLLSLVPGPQTAAQRIPTSLWSTQALAPAPANWWEPPSQQPKTRLSASTRALVESVEASRWIAYAHNGAVPQRIAPSQDALSVFLQAVHMYDAGSEAVLKDLNFPAHVWLDLVDHWSVAEDLPEAQLPPPDVFHIAKRFAKSPVQFTSRMKMLMKPWLIETRRLNRLARMRNWQTEKRLSNAQPADSPERTLELLLRMVIEAWDWDTRLSNPQDLQRLANVLSHPIFKDTDKHGMLRLTSEGRRIALDSLIPLRNYRITFAWYSGWGLLFLAEDRLTREISVYRTQPHPWNPLKREQMRIAPFWFSEHADKMADLLKRAHSVRVDPRTLLSAG